MKQIKSNKPKWRAKVQSGQTDIEYDEITAVMRRKTAKIFQNGLSIEVRGDKEFNFVVNNREQWIEELNKRAGALF